MESLKNNEEQEAKKIRLSKFWSVSPDNEIWLTKRYTQAAFMNFRKEKNLTSINFTEESKKIAIEWFESPSVNSLVSLVLVLIPDYDLKKLVVDFQIYFSKF